MNGEKIKWKYSLDEFKAKTDPITNKKGEVIQYDYSELDAWLEEEFKKHIIPNCKPNPNPYIAPAPQMGPATIDDIPSGTGGDKEEVKPLTGKAKIDKAKQLQDELEKDSGKKSFANDPTDDLPFS